MGGIRIDEYARTTVKGLFAAGEAAGGVHGANRLGGNAGLEVFVFGDIAGNSLVEFLDGDKETANVSFFPTAESEASDVPFDAVGLRESLEGICNKALGVIKNERSLTEANYTVDGIIKKAMEHKDSFEACRLFNDALTVRLLIGAALERKESIGGHVRSDGKAHIGERYTVTLIKDNNSIKVQRRSLL
ncbi:MAG: FAD-binding protein [Clostridia bacterium]|nr:FAD-binding protein [Clostridia bacterium]